MSGLRGPAVQVQQVLRPAQACEPQQVVGRIADEEIAVGLRPARLPFQQQREAGTVDPLDRREIDRVQARATAAQRVLLPPLKGERMRSFFDAMQAATLETVQSWSAGGTLPMIEPMQQITLRVMLQVVLGLRTGAELEDFAGKVRRVLELGRGRYGLILVKMLPVGLLQRTRWLPLA